MPQRLIPLAFATLIVFVAGVADLARAADWPETAAAREALARQAAAGDADAALTLARWYNARRLNGPSLEARLAAVEPMLRLLRQAAEAGSVEAMDELHSVRVSGGEKEVSERVSSLIGQEEATFWLRRAAEGGHEGAMYVLGTSLNTRGSTPAEFAEGATFLLRCAELGDRLCQEAAAGAYEAGRGVEKDTAKALRLYEQVIASDSGTYKPPSMHRAAMLLHTGVPGRPADRAAALALFRQAAEAGWGPSMESLSAYHEMGYGGLSPSLAEALAWLHKAAATNHGNGQRIQGNIARVEALIAGRAPGSATPAAAPVAAPVAKPAAGGRSTACRAVDGSKADAIAYAESLADVGTWQCTWQAHMQSLMDAGPPKMVVRDGTIYLINNNGGSNIRVADGLRLARTYREGIDLVHEFSANCYSQFLPDSAPTAGTVVAKSGFVNNTSDRSVRSYPKFVACGRGAVRRDGARYSEQPYPSL